MPLVSEIQCRVSLLLFSASVQPVAVFPLNKRCGGLELTSRANLATLSRGVGKESVGAFGGIVSNGKLVLSQATLKRLKIQRYY